MKKLQEYNTISSLVEKVRVSGSRLILLDFDGTLVDFTSDPRGEPVSGKLTGLLKRTGEVPDNHLVIITGRGKDDIERLTRNLPVDIIAEHGAFIRQNMVWRPLIEGTTEWKKEVFSLLSKSSRAYPCSFIEEKAFSIAWHYRNMPQAPGTDNSRIVLNDLEKIALKSDLRVFDGNKVVEIISSNVNKGIAVRHLLKNRDYAHILALGDDATDEEMFRVLRKYKNVYTIKVGEGETFARYRLQNPSRVLIFLENLLLETE